MKELTLMAVNENLDTVIDFVNEQLEAEGCSMMAQLQLDIAVEELFINIASYAYRPADGPVTIQIDFVGDTASVVFIDGGRPYNPWDREDPDTTLSAEERDVGGLGVYIVKQSMNNVGYEYKEGKNILTIEKNIQEEVPMDLDM